MVKEIVLINYPESVLVDDEDFEYLNQFEWEAIFQKDGVHAARRVPNGDGTFRMVMMEDMIKRIDY